MMDDVRGMRGVIFKFHKVCEGNLFGGGDLF